MSAFFFTNSPTAGKNNNKLPVTHVISEGLILKKGTDISENRCKLSLVHTLEGVNGKKEKVTENVERLFYEGFLKYFLRRWNLINNVPTISLFHFEAKCHILTIFKNNTQ